MARVFGYARVSTKEQKLERQIYNIKSVYPDAVVITESFTGTTMDRPAWNKLKKTLREGDTVVFDEVSRMARTATEGFETYKELYERGVNLVFIKDAPLNTENFKATAQIAMTGTDVADAILEGVNRALMILAENQIKAAFETAQHEVDYLHMRTSEGVRRAQAQGKQVGRAAGAKITTKKSIAAKQIIQKHSKDFEGHLDDSDVITLAGISRNSYYKYKREIRQEQAGDHI
ncbi:MAG: recombinase family protein [Clostridiales bacterium]|nr:recombinase family protein [Clostridiales bacterium]